MGRTKEKTKKKTLEDIIPEDLLADILKTYHKICDIENFSLKETKLLIYQLLKIKGALQNIADNGWLSKGLTSVMFDIIEDEVWYKNKKGYDLDLILGPKSDLETVISRYDIKTREFIESRKKTKGQPKQYAKSYLIGVLAAEIKDRSNKANYELLANFLDPYYSLDSKRLALEVKRIRESGDVPRLIRTIDIEYPNTLIE